MILAFEFLVPGISISLVLLPRKSNIVWVADLRVLLAEAGVIEIRFRNFGKHCLSTFLPSYNEISFKLHCFSFQMLLHDSDGVDLLESTDDEDIACQFLQRAFCQVRGPLFEVFEFLSVLS